MSSPIDFWFSIGSTNSYLSVMRVEDVARPTGVTIRWRPFDVRAMMIKMNNIPFIQSPPKCGICGAASDPWNSMDCSATLPD
jgi:2-hydroxychromene-2-carboxylate isomerase